MKETCVVVSLVKNTLMFSLAFLAIVSCKKEKRPDLVVPEIINGSGIMAYEFASCYVNQIYYPYGTTVTVSGSMKNEFYSL